MRLNEAIQFKKWKELGVKHISKQSFARGIDTKKGKKKQNLL